MICATCGHDKEALAYRVAGMALKGYARTSPLNCPECRAFVADVATREARRAGAFYYEGWHCKEGSA